MYRDLTQTVQAIQESYPNILDQPGLSSLLPSLLLALIARDTNLIVSTTHPSQLQKSIAKLLSTVFGLQVKRVKVRAAQSPTQMLESLFFSSPSSSSSAESQKHKSRASFRRSVSAPRPPSSIFTEHSDSTAPHHHGTPAWPRHKTDPGVLYNADPQLSLRLPQAVVICHLETAGRPAHLAIADTLRSRRIAMESGVWNLPQGFFVIHVSAATDATERPTIHPSLLDHFAFSVTLSHNQNQDPTPPATSSSPRVRSFPLPSPNQKPPLFPYDSLPSPDAVHPSPFIINYTTAILTAVRHHPELDGTLLTARCVKDAERLVRTSGLVFRQDERMTLTEAHVRRMMPPILAHRLRVRDNPREQIMGILSDSACARNWGKTQMEEATPNKRTIKTILAEILTEV